MSIKREDLRVAIVSGGWVADNHRRVTDADLAALGYYRLEASRMRRDEMLRELLTEDCETCEGTGEVWGRPVHEPASICLDCGGTGKKLRDGVERDKFDDTGPVIIFPAEWLEAE